MAWQSYGPIQYRSRVAAGEEVMLRLERLLRDQPAGGYQFLREGSAGRASRGGGVADRRRRPYDLALYDLTLYAASASGARYSRIRWLSGSEQVVGIAVYRSTNLAQYGLEVTGPAQGKYAKIAFSAVEYLAGAGDPDPEAVDLVIRSDTGVHISALNYSATCRFKVDTMDAWFTNKVGIGVAPSTTVHLKIAGLEQVQGLYLMHSLPQTRWYETDAADDASDFIRQTYTANNFCTDWYDASASTYYTRLVLEGDTGLLDIYGDTIRLRTARTPASAAAAGNAGDKCWDANYEYRCIATDTWTRVARATW